MSMNTDAKQIAGYGGRYLIDSSGRVYSKLSNKYLNLANKGGYLQVGLSKGGKTKWFSVHRLVAKYFIPNRENLPQVNHKNGIKHDNSVENLEWCTVSENHLHAFRTGLKDHKGVNHSQAKLCDLDVLFIRKWCDDGFLLKEVAELFDISFQSVSNIKLRKSWVHV